MRRIRLITPVFPPVAEVAADYDAIVGNGVFSNGGPFERRFAMSLASWIGNGAVVSVVSSATSALELAIQAMLGSNARKRVLVPSFTFAAGPLAVIRAGFTPLFIDIDANTWQPSMEDAAAALEEHDDVGGILLTSTFGVANEAVADWERLAQGHGLPLIIDSAAGFGSLYPWGEPLGARGDCEVFSLHATKTLAIGEGGAVVSRDPRVAATVDQLKNFGFDNRRQSAAVGTNAKLSELSSAIGMRQLARLPGRLRARQAILAAYRARLEPLGVAFQPGVERAAIPFVSALLPTEEWRDRFVAALENGLVECRTYYNPPAHRHSVFGEWRSDRALPATDDIAARIISLPMADDLSDDAVERVADAAADVLVAGR
jgi:dTDP-4-amino-4,6-dideoxygalactose transaminase